MFESITVSLMYLFVITLLARHSDALTTWQQVVNHPAWAKLAKFECGDSAADRIIGGTNAALGQFPWIARLGYNNSDEELDFMCGGTLITDRHVVTAAHCLQTADDEYKLSVIRLGEHNARTDPDCQLGACAPRVQDRHVKAIRTHAQFNKPAFHNDIAIIELEEPAELNDYVAPVCLPRKDQLEDKLSVGDMVTVAGWGKMNMSTEQRANILQVVSLPVMSPSLCNTFGKGFKVTESEICAGAQHNKDACGGDSGGPLMKVYDTDEGPKNFLVGVVSFGPTVCGIKKPGVYSSVSFFLNWILDNLFV